MKADIAKQSLWPTSLLLVGLSALFFWRAWTAPLPAEALLPDDVLLGGWLQRLLDDIPWLTQGLLLLLTLVNALRITRVTTRGMVYVVRSFLPMVFFVIAACGLYMTPRSALSMVVVWLLISASNRFIASFRRARCFDTLFRGGLVMGMLPLLWPAALPLWGLVPVALLLFRRNGCEAIVAVTALLLPVALWSYVEWLLGGRFTQAAMTIWGYLTTPSGFEPWAMGAGRWIVGSLLALLVVLSAGHYLLLRGTMRTRPARIVLYFLALLAVAVGMFWLPCRSVMLFAVLAAGVAVVAPIYFSRQRGTTPAVFYGAIVICSIVVALFS